MLLTPKDEGNSGSIKIRAGQNWEGMPAYYGGWNVSEDGFELYSQFKSNVMCGKVLGKGRRFVQTGSGNGYYLCDADAPVLVYTGERISLWRRRRPL